MRHAEPVLMRRPAHNDQTVRQPRAPGTSLISTSQPTALAYFLSVLTDGEWAPALSSRETELLVVPMEAATCSWVSPARTRAASSSLTSLQYKARPIPSRPRARSSNGPSTKGRECGIMSAGPNPDGTRSHPEAIAIH